MSAVLAPVARHSNEQRRQPAVRGRWPNTQARPSVKPHPTLVHEGTSRYREAPTPTAPADRSGIPLLDGPAAAKALTPRGEVPGSLTEHFSSLIDPRMERSRLHALQSILVVALCAIICGAEDWVSVARYGRLKEQWFQGFLELPNGIPSHHTFRRVFAALDSAAFGRCFTAWAADMAVLVKGDVVAIDGKTVRRSLDRATAQSPLHMVSAYADRVGLVLGQLATEEKSNEITAIPQLLDTLNIDGCTVTIDAMGCQKKITEKIASRNGEYVIGLKNNQPKMAEAVRQHFEKLAEDGFEGRGVAHFAEESPKKAHGRIEHREIFCTSDLSCLGESALEWKNLRSLVLVCSTRDDANIETRFYISSLPANDPKKMAHAIRSHWSIENKLHWVLDVAFNEDASRVRKDHGASNLSTLRHMAVNLLKQEKTAKVGVKNKRLSAGWDNDYLLQVLGF
jgi:predicted transposase YbfD/YdcC